MLDPSIHRLPIPFLQHAFAYFDQPRALIAINRHQPHNWVVASAPNQPLTVTPFPHCLWQLPHNLTDFKTISGLRYKFRPSACISSLPLSPSLMRQTTLLYGHTPALACLTIPRYTIVTYECPSYSWSYPLRLTL